MDQNRSRLKLSENFERHWSILIGGAPKERRRRRVKKRLSKRVFLESPFLLWPPKGFQGLASVSKDKP